MEPKWSIGVISGTSMDGIDVALLRTDGRDLIEHGPGATFPYPASLREALVSVINTPAQAEFGDLSTLEDAVTDAHCDAVAHILDTNGISPAISPVSASMARPSFTGRNVASPAN